MNEIRVDTSWTTKTALLIVVTMLLCTVSSIRVPDDFLEDLEKFERINSDDNDAGNRSLIIAETMKRYKQNRLFSRSIPCISSLLQNRSISFWYSTSVIPSFFDYVERKTPVEIDLLVHTLQVETATYMVNDVEAIDDTENFASTVIVVIENLLDLEKMNYSHYLKMCSFDCEFVVITARIFVDEEEFLREADILEQLMWSKFVGRLVILGSTRETVLLAGSRSFKPEESCVPSAPILLGSCRTSSTSTVDKSTVWQLNAEPIDGRDFLMNGCALLVAYYNNPPYSFVGTETANNKISGLEGIMAEEILYSMNARIARTMIYAPPSGERDDVNFQKLAGLIKNSGSQVHLLIGGLGWNPHRWTDYTIAYDVVPFVWVTPIMINVSLRGLISPFSTFVWIAIFGIIFLGILVMIFLIKNMSFLDILALILGTSVFRQPTLASSRILFLCWSFFGFFVSQYYLASLAEQLVNTSNLQIETMEELLSSGLELGGTSHHANLFNDFDENDEDDDENLVSQRIRERFHAFTWENYTLQLSSLIDEKNQSMALVVKSNFLNSGLNLPKQAVHVLNEKIGACPVAFATWKGFPCLRKINRKMQQSVESGIVKYWTRMTALSRIYYRLKKQPKSDTNVHLDSAIPIFLVLIIGYLVGFCFLIIEIIAYPSKWLA